MWTRNGSGVCRKYEQYNGLCLRETAMVWTVAG